MNTTKLLFLYPNIPMSLMLPAGIASLNGQLKKLGVETKLFETTEYTQDEESSEDYRMKIGQIKPVKNGVDSTHVYKGDVQKMHKDFETLVNEYQPDVIAVSANDFTHNIAKSLIVNIHTWAKKSPIVVIGGIYATFFPAHAIKNDDIDIAVVGEGFIPLEHICKNFSDYESLLKTPNAYINFVRLWYRFEKEIYQGVSGPLVINPLAPPVDINTLEFDDYTCFDESRLSRPMGGTIRRMLNVWLDIGCPYSCAFCAAPALRKIYDESGSCKKGSYLRVKTIDRLKDEMRYLIGKYKPDFIYFSTETFFARSDRHIQEFADFYINEIHLPFWAETRVETITDERAEMLKQMGCERLSMGLESGDENFRRNVLNKTFTNEQFLNAVDICQNHGLKLTINHMVGLPDETLENIMSTIEISRLTQTGKTDVSISASIYAPCGGERLHQVSLDKGYYDLDEYLSSPWGSFHREVWLDQPQLSKAQVRGIFRCFTMYIKMPKSMFPLIKQAETDDEVFGQLLEYYQKNY